MEQQLEVMRSEVKQTKMIRAKSLLLPASVGVMFALICLLAWFLIIERNKVIELEIILSSTKSELLSLSSKVNSVEREISSTEDDTDIRNELKALQDNVYIQGVQHRMENGVITDDFVVEKASIIALPVMQEGAKGFLSMTIDLSIQPSLNSQYTGQGSFNIPDRELKAKIMDVYDEIAESYTNKYHAHMPPIEDGSIHFTVKNYDLATFENGTLKLKGE